MPNSIDFHERVFLHDVPARIIVPLETLYRKCKLYIKNDTFLFFVNVIYWYYVMSQRIVLKLLKICK